MRINKEETIKNFSPKMDWKALSVAENVNDRVEGFEDENTELYDKICQAVDDELIYTVDQWGVISSYISPNDIGNVSYCDIINEFIEDIFNNCVVE